MKVPCGKVCPDREAECKRTCEKWAEYEAWYMEDRKEKEKQYDYNADFFSYLSDRVRINQKKGVKR